MAKRSITTNPLIDQLKSAGGGVGTQRLAGFVGRSSDGKIELYTDLSMASFVEIAEADVVHVIDGEKPSDPSQLFVRQDARVQIRHSTTLKDLAKGGCDCGTPVRTIAQQRDGGGFRHKSRIPRHQRGDTRLCRDLRSESERQTPDSLAVARRPRRWWLQRLGVRMVTRLQ